MPSTDLFDDEFLRRLQRLGMIAKRVGSASRVSGQHRRRTLGDGLEFADHRAYSPGDDVRFLDWPYFARMEKLLLRLFHEHSEGVVAVLLDRSGSMGLGEPPKFDHARRLSAALAYVAMCGLDRVRLLPFSDGLDEGMQTGRNRGQILDVLGFLEDLAVGGRTGLAASIAQYRRRYSEPGMVFIVSDLLDCQDDLGDALTSLRQRRDEVVVLHVVDHCDSAPSCQGAVELVAAEKAGRLPVFVTDEIEISYSRNWERFARASQNLCQGKGACYLAARTELPFEKVVLQALSVAGIMGS